MLSLKQVDFMQIQHWFVDYQKKSRNFEMPPDYAELIGIYDGDVLIGYFIVIRYQSGVLEINQGYLNPEARHKKNQYIALRLLEDAAKKAGHNKIVLGTNRAVSSYQAFMRKCGFSLVRAEFAKEI